MIYINALGCRYGYLSALQVEVLMRTVILDRVDIRCADTRDNLVGELVSIVIASREVNDGVILLVTGNPLLI